LAGAPAFGPNAATRNPAAHPRVCSRTARAKTDGAAAGCTPSIHRRNGAVSVQSQLRRGQTSFPSGQVGREGMVCMATRHSHPQLPGASDLPHWTAYWSVLACRGETIPVRIRGGQAFLMRANQALASQQSSLLGTHRRRPSIKTIERGYGQSQLIR